MTMRRSRILFGFFGLVISVADVAAQTCADPPSPGVKGEVLLLPRHRGALLLVGEPSFNDGELNARDSTNVAGFYSGCYVLDRSRRQDLIWFAVNNHIGRTVGNAVETHYLGVQVFLLKRRGQQSASSVQAYRSPRRQWYRQSSPIPNYAANNSPGMDIAAWNNAHHPGNVVQNADTALKGQWHGSPIPNGPYSWNERAWWRVNPDILNSFEVRLHNSLFSFDGATGGIASGIPFYVEPGQSDGMIVRYYSSSPEMPSGEVHFCFVKEALEAICRAIAALQVSDPAPASTTQWWLFRLFR